MRIIYMGTPEFAVPSLELLNKRFEVLAAVSQPDKPKGRGNKLTPPPVKVKAMELGIKVMQPLKVRDEAFIAELRAMNPDVIMVAAYSRLIPKTILDLPRFGCINLHPSFLPRYRGAIPVQAAIMNGDTVTGITTFRMDEGYDTGDILIQHSVDIKPGETGTELLERLARLGAEALAETAEGLEKGILEPVKQVGEAEYTKPLKKEDLFVNWTMPAIRVTNFIRALYAEPCAQTLFEGQPLKLGKAVPADDTCEASGFADAAPGTIIAIRKGKGPVVKCGEGAVILEQVKPSGKGWMDGASFVNGRRLSPGAALGNL